MRYAPLVSDMDVFPHVRMLGILGLLAAFSLPCVYAQTNGVDAVAMNVQADHTFFVIDGKPLKESLVRDTVLIIARIREIRKRKINPKNFNAWANSIAPKVAKGLISAILIDAELDRRGVLATPQSDAKMLERYRRSTKMKGATFDAIAKKFGSLEPLFRRQFARESRFVAFMDGQGLETVTDEQLVAFYKNATNRLERCRKINEVAQAKAEATWKRLDAGEPWDIVATNATEDALLEPTYADNWESWMVLQLSKVDPPELAIALKGMKAGAFTRPILTDEGIVIAKVNETDETTYDLARILIRSAIDYKIPNRDEAIKSIRRDRKEEFQMDLVNELMSRAKIEYPLGTNFVYKIWQ